MSITTTPIAYRPAGPHRTSARPIRPATPDGTMKPSHGDRVELSAASQELARAGGTSPARMARIAQIRAEIRAGRYDTEERFDAAIDRLLESIAGGIE